MANLVGYLEAQGHLSAATGGGISGLHLATCNTYDVIIVDLVLPGLDGVSLCKCLREEAGKLTPLLMLTARDSLRAHLHVLRNAIDKPFDKPLLQTLRGIGWRITDPDTNVPAA